MSSPFAFPHARRLPAFLVAALLAHDLPAAEKISFNRDVRPILSDNCFHCHGNGEKDRKGGLRLDVRDAALKGGESGAAFVPGKPEKSELITRILSHDPDELMPPKKSNKTLKPEQIETLRRWIAEGAEYQGHWAFIKPERPAAPKIAEVRVANAEWKNAAGGNGDWSANAIDGFIIRKLAEQGLAPSKEAPPETLIRRMTLDLTGIPPTPAETDAFVKQWNAATSIASRNSAISSLADRLLASPRYGEQMAQQWLDFARYADSNGFQSDTSRQMHHWRDWVLNAFNRNMPFDRFTIDQLGGDLVPNATRDQIVATGFNRNQRLNGEGGRIVEEWFAETVIDRVETVGSTWLALTYNCCRCHDHKYDPITQREFYQMFAFFNSNDETGVLDDFGGAARTRAGGNSRPVLDIATPEQEKQQSKIEIEVKAAEQRVAEAQKQLPKLQKEWETKFRAEVEQQGEAWKPLAATEVKSEGGATLTKQPDGSWLASGTNPKSDTYTITAPIAAGEFTGLRIEALPDASLPNKSLGRAGNGNFVLSDVEVEITAASLPQQLRAEFMKAEASYEQKDWAIKSIVDQTTKKSKDPKIRRGWAIGGNLAGNQVARKAIFVVGTPVTVPPDATIIVRLRQESIHANHNVGRFRLDTSSLPPQTVKLDGVGTPEAIRAALAVDAAKRTPAQRDVLAKFYRENSDNPVSRAEREVTEARKKLTELQKTIPTTMVMRELPQPRETFLLKRGEYDKRGDKVERALPSWLPPMPAGAPMNRLGLAQWIVSPENPLTARVWVNRAWEKFFGTGLAKTTENFGSQADWPSHPELLDWLATEFVRLKWDMKAIQKLIVTSATYRQSSRVTPEAIARDPENRLLSHASRFRLPAEALRDQALAVSGLLVEKVGGPSVRPYMPPAVWDETSVYGDMRGYKEDTGEGLYRRTLYTIWKRTAAPPTMMLFDSPTREICTVKRSRTNTPLQALSLLNEVTYVEAARVLAQRMIAEGGATAEERIAWAFRRATARAPREGELKVLAAGLTKRLARYQQTPDEAQKLLTFGSTKVDPKLAAAELAAYATTANVLLNLDEVVTRE